MEFRALQGGMVTTQVNEGTGVNMPGIIVGVGASLVIVCGWLGNARPSDSLASVATK